MQEVNEAELNKVIMPFGKGFKSFTTMIIVANNLEGVEGLKYNGTVSFIDTGLKKIGITGRSRLVEAPPQLPPPFNSSIIK